MKSNCFIDIDGIYDYHFLKTFFSYQSMKRNGLLKAYVLLGTDLWIPLGTPISSKKVVTEIFLNLQWTNDGSKICVCSA
jgi:hypothetical protein